MLLAPLLPPRKNSTNSHRAPPRRYPYFIGFPGPKNFADVDFGSLGAHPFDQWASVPAEGKVQIIATLGMIELLSEMQKPHPTNRDNADEIGSVELLWNGELAVACRAAALGTQCVALPGTVVVGGGGGGDAPAPPRPAWRRTCPR